jgi:hypothetical protein
MVVNVKHATPIEGNTIPVHMNFFVSLWSFWSPQPLSNQSCLMDGDCRGYHLHLSRVGLPYIRSFPLAFLTQSRRGHSPGPFYPPHPRLTVLSQSGTPDPLPKSFHHWSLFGYGLSCDASKPIRLALVRPRTRPTCQRQPQPMLVFRSIL